jgi:VanZ family protein
LQPGVRSKSEIARAWFWVAAWIALVQIFASGSFSATETSRFLAPLLRWLFPEVQAKTISAVHFAIRKSGHVVIYAILALLAQRAFYASFERPRAWIAAASLALALAVAIVDEGRQSLAKNRTGAVSDVALDMGGAAAALALASAGRRLWGSRT